MARIKEILAEYHDMDEEDNAWAVAKYEMAEAHQAIIARLDADCAERRAECARVYAEKLELEGIVRNKEARTTYTAGIPSSQDDLFDSSGNVTIGVNNLFDWEPRRLPVQGGFESRLYDNFGRMLSISLDVEL